MAKPSQADILRLGPDIASLKASMPRKRWRDFVKGAHKQGHTVRGQLSNAPTALKERTQASLRKQADHTVAAAYKPVMAELDRRALAQQYLEKKRADDDAAYRTWTMGEVDKLDAQARAADALLVTQQSDIAADLATAQQASHADSLQRVAQQAGTVSDPSQSTALDQSAADTRSREQVAAAREHTAAVSKVGADANQMSRAAVIATAAVREATRKADDWRTTASITADRTQALTGRAKDSAALLQELRVGETANAKAVAELDLAGEQLGVKRLDIAQEAKSAARKYRLDRDEFKLGKWKAEHADTVAQAKVQLGYDQIAARNGQKAADRALDKWIAKHKTAAAKAKEKGDKKGVTPEERKLYQTVETVRAIIVRKRGKGKDDAQIRTELLATGFDAVTIGVANDLTQGDNMGVLSNDAKALAKRLGIKHVGYFWG